MTESQKVSLPTNEAPPLGRGAGNPAGEPRGIGWHKLRRRFETRHYTFRLSISRHEARVFPAAPGPGQKEGPAVYWRGHWAPSKSRRVLSPCAGAAVWRGPADAGCA